MQYCERCGSRYSSVRAKHLTHCPRCLLRSDIATPLIHADDIARRRPAPLGPVRAQTERPVSPRV
jgi:predicted  nucleic acid-binding Zn-ribbon protein